ncbi:MAG: glycosyl hydrolase family 17 protein [Planctomycetota bacterium]|nr:glycosyl hydrolase family 17 protein [Planctomycetota bacterium]
MFVNGVFISRMSVNGMLRSATAPVFGMMLVFCSALSSVATAQVAPADRRPFVLPSTPQAWGGVGVCYGAMRDGQYPGGPEPTKEQIREDLHIIAKHWAILRMYSSRGAAELACQVIREDKLPLRLVVGAWIAQESKRGPQGEPVDVDPQIVAVNQAEVREAIRLANEYPDVVMAINIANEALVFWSAHRVPVSVIVNYIRQTRAETKLPVTTFDTELFWLDPESVQVAAECDYLGLHAYAMWNGQQISDAMHWTRDRLEAVRAKHPGLPIVLGELGWATSKGTQGDQARLISAKPNERDQELFFRTLRDWAIEVRQPYFWFSAFDENWKGGPEPEEVEKHWGVYKADRTPKAVFQTGK